MAVNNVLGIDIGTTAIRAVVLSHRNKPPKLLSIGKVATPQPGITSEADLDLDALANAIKNLVAEIKSPTREVVVALPESKIFTRVIYDLPYLTNEELAQAIRFAAEEFVPMPIQDVNLNYQVLFRSPQKGPNSRTVVFAVATPKTLVEKYLRVLTSADLKPLAVETELIATSRALVGFNTYSPTTLVVQLNTLTTDFAVVSDGLILLTRSIATGGLAMTRAIAQSFGFEMIQAEEYKKVYGLLQDQLEGKLFNVLKPIVDIIISEAKRVIQAHETQNPDKKIKRIVLSGGGSALPGLVIYLATALGYEVQEADPWQAIDKDPALKAKLAGEISSYSLAIGLALWEG